MYFIPWVLSVFGRFSLLNCGLCLLRGTVRTSTSRVTLYVLSNSTNSSMVLVECPIVKIVNCGSLAKHDPSGRVNADLKYKISTYLVRLRFGRSPIKETS